MPLWWESPESLAALTTWLRVAIVVFGVLTAAATGFTIITSNRIDYLRAEERKRLANRLGEAEGRALEAEKRAAEATKRTAPRTVTPQQAEVLVRTLAPLRGRQLAITLITSDGEAYRFGQQLVSALMAAGINVVLSTVDFPGAGQPIEGLILQAAPGAGVHAENVRAALASAGFESLRQNDDPHLPPNTVNLTVGRSRPI